MAVFVNDLNRAVRRDAAKLMAAMIFVAVIACGYGDWPSRYDEFFELPVSDRRTAILRYAPSDQMELHIHATCDLHPAYEHLAGVIVAQRRDGILDALHQAVAGNVPDDPNAAGCRAYALTLVVKELDRNGVAVDAATRARLAGASVTLPGKG